MLEILTAMATTQIKLSSGSRAIPCLEQGEGDSEESLSRWTGTLLPGQRLQAEVAKRNQRAAAPVGHNTRKHRVITTPVRERVPRAVAAGAGGRHRHQTMTILANVDMQAGKYEKW